MLVSVVLVVVGIIVAFGLGLALGLYLKGRQTSSLTELASQILKKSEVELQTQVEAVKSEMRASFGSISLDVLNTSTEQFLKVADSKFQTERQDHAKELDSKKQLIDEKLGALSTELENMRKLTGELEKDRYQKFGELAKQLTLVNDQTNDLRKTTGALREALASSKVRGQWGERMAEDVLRAAGFLEGVNYTKQKAIEQSGTKPDFTFLLPSKRCLNMDVKFPFDNFLRYVEAENETDKERFRKDFLKRCQGEGQGDHHPRLYQPGSKYSRLCSAVHPQRADVCVHPPAGSHCTGRRSEKPCGLLLAAHSVCDPGGHAAGGREFCARADLE